jgi:5'-nucleotidase
MRTILTYAAMFVMAMASSVTLGAQDLVILHTNDVHSQITPQITPRLIGDGQGLGGYERREAYVRQVVKEHGKKNVLILDGGDFSMGSSPFAIYKGDVEIELFNVLGYDAVCLGNHEFDRGHEELAHRLANAKFDVLCANYDFSESPINSLVKPYTIVKKGGKKIGIIGLIIDMKNMSMGRNSKKNPLFLDPTEVLNRLAAELKTVHKCDLVIALSHCGLYTGRDYNPSDEIIAAASENVDIIVGGHTHTYLEKMLTVKNRKGEDVLIVQAGANGEYVGRLDLYW